MNSAVHGLRDRARFWTQLSENLSALRTPSHFAGGCGGRQRKFPTGGAAKGIPLKTRTPGIEPATPSSKPLSTRTVPLIAVARGGRAIKTARNNRQQSRFMLFDMR